MDYPVQFKSLKPFALLINLHPIERVLTFRRSHVEKDSSVGHSVFVKGARPRFVPVRAP
jgi:hypothetical protein